MSIDAAKVGAESTSAEMLGDVCVLGLGRTGLAVASYLADLLGDRVRSVTLYGGARSAENDTTQELKSRGVRVVCGTEDIEGVYDLAVASPGIPEGSAFFRAAAAHAREIIGEPEFAWRESPWRWVTITGTNGKTTTTLLANDLLFAGGLKSVAVGNVGTVATGEVAVRDADTWFVAELSSFQLATATQLHPRVACLLNITPDHLEWHGSLEAYAEAKMRMFDQLTPGDLAVVSEEDSWCRQAIECLEGRGLRVCRVAAHGQPTGAHAAFVRNERLVVRLDGVEHELVLADSLSIRGAHNIQNALVASVAALELGVSDKAVCHGLLAFRPLEHRIEPCGKIGDVSFVNDSKATNADATEKALSSFMPGRVIVLLGGHDKGTELSSLAHEVSCRCKAAICYGEAGPRIANALREADADMGLTIEMAPHMKDAVETARNLADAGDVVLLSPACSSFDEFRSYQERGRTFKQIVLGIASKNGLSS